MRFFDFFLQLSATRAWPLPAFLPFSLTSFYRGPRVIRYTATSISTTTSPTMLSRPSSPANSCPQMPLELVLSFIEAACSEVGHDTMQLLMTCSLVCRTWSAASQKLLFSRVTLRNQRACELFMNAVGPASIHGRILGNAVRRLRVVLDHNQPFSLHHHSFALTITLCPNLSELEISLYGCAEPGEDVVGMPHVSHLRKAAPSFDDYTISLLKSGPKIKYLHFDNWSENQQSLFQLLDIWPSSLRFLSIGGSSPQCPQEFPLSFACPLRGIRFNFQNTPPIDFTKWLLHNSIDSLRVVHFERDPCNDLFEYIVKTYGPTLQVISIPAFGSPECFTLITKCIHLKELRTKNPSCSQTLYRHISNEIEHLTFGLDRDTPLNAVIEVIKTRDSLKTVNAEVWDGGYAHTLLSPLKIACAFRGISLTFGHDLPKLCSNDISASSSNESCVPTH